MHHSQGHYQHPHGYYHQAQHLPQQCAPYSTPEGIVGILGGVTNLASSFLYGSANIVKGVMAGALWGAPCHTEHHGCGNHHSDNCCDSHHYSVECRPPHYHSDCC